MSWLRVGLLACFGVLVLNLLPAWRTGLGPTRQPVPGAQLPRQFGQPVYAPAQNPPERRAFELGRQLFYDARLSADGTVSCGSCHQQARAFASPERLSQGVGGRPGLRNAPALQNLRWRRTFFADGGPKHLETLPLAPLTNPREMGTTLPAVLAKLNADSAYARQFAAVYGQRPISSYQLLRALAQFTAALTSASSRYDYHVRRAAGGRFTAPERRGQALFRAKCGSCHATELFTDGSFRNNGLNRRFGQDSGRVVVTFLPTDRGRFAVPSLRNVARTAPYMHDGRFGTLAQVLAHYDHGMVASPTLDPIFRGPNGRLGIPLTAAEQRALLAFLATLTDEAFCRAPEFAAPRPSPGGKVRAAVRQPGIAP